MIPIQGHAVNPTNYLTFLGKPKGEIFYGVELEVEVEGEMRAPTCGCCAPVKVFDRQAALEKAQAALGDDFVIFKHDGSLQAGGEGGFEIVTAPASLLVHAKRWEKFFASEPSSYLQVSDRCGVHVHVSRAPLEHDRLKKMLTFIHDPANEKLVVGIAGRSSERFAKRYRKTPAEIAGLLTNRYEALNLTNTRTVEVRIFAATLEKDLFLARLEFVVALVEWGEGELINWVLAHPRRFPHLTTWLKDHSKVYALPTN